MTHSSIQTFNSKNNKVVSYKVEGATQQHSDRVYRLRDDMQLKYAVIDPSTGRNVVTYCETWRKSAYGWSPHGFLWTPLHSGFTHAYAGGWGYDKSSSAVAGCIREAGIKLAHSCSGVGGSAAVAALVAIAAKATGKRRFIVVRG